MFTKTSIHVIANKAIFYIQIIGECKEIFPLATEYQNHLWNVHMYTYMHLGMYVYMYIWM